MHKRLLMIAVVLLAGVALAQTAAPAAAKPSIAPAQTAAPAAAKPSVVAAQTAAPAAAKPSIALAQAPAAAAAAGKPSTATADLQSIVNDQFGPDFEVITASPLEKIGGAVIEERRSAPWTPILTGDLDGDGVEDAVIVARNKNTLIGAEAYGYVVVDPFHERYGWGNVKITGEFNSQDPLHNLHLLVIHGTGDAAWRAEKPKAKYVLINIPFEQMSLARALLKKKPVDAIRVEESDTISSLVFWDGKKYRYSPGGAMP